MSQLPSIQMLFGTSTLLSNKLNDQFHNFKLQIKEKYKINQELLNQYIKENQKLKEDINKINIDLANIKNDMHDFKNIKSDHKKIISVKRTYSEMAKETNDVILFDKFDGETKQLLMMDDKYVVKTNKMYYINHEIVHVKKIKGNIDRHIDNCIQYTKLSFRVYTTGTYEIFLLNVADPIIVKSIYHGKYNRKYNSEN